MPQTLFVNASFITLNPAQPRAGALLADGGRIRAIGDEAALRHEASGATDRGFARRDGAAGAD